MHTPRQAPEHQRRQERKQGIQELSRRRFLQLTGVIGAFGGGVFAATAPAAGQSKVSKETLKTVSEVAGADIPEAQLEKLLTPLEGYLRAVGEMRQVDAGLTEAITVFVMRERHPHDRRLQDPGRLRPGP
jgi:Asp-tRNA(Asn)/Glu-tRNA(Gln) amidotransferase C subunit